MIRGPFFLSGFQAWRRSTWRVLPLGGIDVKGLYRLGVS